MPADTLSSVELRALAVATLDKNPDATFEALSIRLRSRLGRNLEGTELDELRQAYDAERADPTGGHRVGAVEAASIVRKLPFRPRRIELIGLGVALLPLIVHIETRTPSTVGRNGVDTPGAVYDFAAMMCGFVAIILGIVAIRLLRGNVMRPIEHYAVSAVIILLGVYQSALGLGLLHQVGLFKA